MRNKRNYTWLTYPQLYFSVSVYLSAPAQRGWGWVWAVLSRERCAQNIYIYLLSIVEKVWGGGGYCEKDKRASWKQVNMEAR